MRLLASGPSSLVIGQLGFVEVEVQRSQIADGPSGLEHVDLEDDRAVVLGRGDLHARVAGNGENDLPWAEVVRHRRFPSIA